MRERERKKKRDVWSERIGLTGAPERCSQAYFIRWKKTSTRLNVLMSVWLSTTIEMNMKHYDNMLRRITVLHFFFFFFLICMCHTSARRIASSNQIEAEKKKITNWINYTAPVSSCRTNLISHNAIVTSCRCFCLPLFNGQQHGFNITQRKWINNKPIEYWSYIQLIVVATWLASLFLIFFFIFFCFFFL